VRLVNGNLIPFGLDANGNEWSFVVEPGRPENEYDVAYLRYERS